MINSKTKRIRAFKKLMKVVKEDSFELYTTSKDNYHRISRSWPVGWKEDLGDGRFKSKADRQEALDGTLEHFIEADFPDSVEQMQKERKLVRLILDAGANPNLSRLYRRGFESRDFDLCVGRKKYYVSLEIAKTNGFSGPQDSDKTFERLATGLDQLQRQEKSVLSTQNLSDCKELVYTLFQKGVYPRNQVIFSKLAPIVLEKDPEFFDKKKQQAITRLAHARTPVQIFNALMGNRKEKI